MKKCLALSIVLCLFLSFADLSARARRVKFGKLSDVEFESSLTCPIDSSAKAYYIFDKGYTTFRFNRSFRIKSKRHIRIKILDEGAFDYAQFSFDFYKEDGQPLYVIDDVEGFTYNSVNGELTSTAFDPCQVQVAELDKYTQRVSFSMPNVKVGSVIELRYTIKTRDMRALDAWLFQYDIPVLKSEYHIEIPEYFTYAQYSYGTIPIKTEQYTSMGQIVLTGDAEFNYTSQVLLFRADSVPAYLAKGTRPITDLGARVEFALKRSQVSDILLEIVEREYRKGLDQLEPTQWYYINKALRNSEDFGLRLNEKVDIQALKEQVVVREDDLANINKAYQLVRQHIQWNGKKSCYALKPLNCAISKGKGNAAEVNLTLVALLQSLGYEAYPVVLSTVDNGIIRSYQPSLALFNYVIVACLCKGEIVLMDATRQDLKINEIPECCENGQGLLSKPITFQWVDLD